MENNFEKTVHNKLSGLQLTPSGTVWGRIEEGLKKRKRRKRLLWFVLPASLLFIAVGISYFVEQRGAPGTHQELSRITPSATKHPLPSADRSNIAERKSSVPASVSPSKTPLLEKGGDAGSGQAIKIAEKSIMSNEDVIEPERTNGFPLANTRTVKLNTEAPAHLNQSDAVADLSVPSPGTLKVHRMLPPLTAAVLHSGSIKNQIPAVHKSAVPDAAAEKPEQKKPPKWEVGVVVSPGMTFLTSGNSSPASTGNMLSAPVTSLNRNPNQGLLANDWYSAPEYGRGFAFNAGITVSRNLTDRIGVSAAVVYQHSNIPQSALHFPGISQTATETHFNNIFHTLQVPIDFTWKTRVWGRQVKWTAGATVAHLLSVNALQYDGNRFYRRDALFSRTHLGFNAGFSIRMVESKGLNLYIGPEYYFDAGKLAGEGVFANQHINFAGIKTTVSFSKMK